MSDHEPYPAPGAPPPGAPPPGATPTPAGPPPGGGWTPPPPPPPGMLGAAHKPGAIALRPLGLGDIFDAAFRIIRFNPKATVGAAALVAALTMAIPVLITALLTFTVGTALDSGELGSNNDIADLVGLSGSFVSLAGGAILLQVGLVLVTGMVAHVTMAAALGQRLSLGEAWRATHGKRWRLLGLVLLTSLVATVGVVVWILSVVALAVGVQSTVTVVLYAVLSGLFVLLPAELWFWIRIYYLPAPALMLEPIGVLDAIGRGYALTRGQFWRIFGIALLTLVVTSIAGNIFGIPITIAGELLGFAVPDYAVLVLVVTQALTSVLGAAFTAPFTSAVTSLQYLDQRMRKEAFDVELMSRAGVLG